MAIILRDDVWRERKIDETCWQKGNLNRFEKVFLKQSCKCPKCVEWRNNRRKTQVP